MTSAVVLLHLLVCLAVQGYAQDVNIARFGTATRSSGPEDAPVERTIDGNTASSWRDLSCTHTNEDYEPWWRLDLQTTYTINSVTITTLKDCCSERLQGAEIRIGNSPIDNGKDNPRCAVISSIGAGVSKTFDCTGMVGRYVNIVIPGRRDYLILCEVEVFGSKTDT